MSMESTSQKTSSRSAVSKDMELQLQKRGDEIQRQQMEILSLQQKKDGLLAKFQAQERRIFQLQESLQSKDVEAEHGKTQIEQLQSELEATRNLNKQATRQGETCADSSDVFLFAAGRGRQPIDIRLSVMAVTRRGLPIESITGAEALVESCGDGEPQKKKRATEQSISSSRGETLGSPVYER
ncbi:UNVERIFIED_CONTAM: hypothetical protein FKN15_066647 [Acipenser sinensis]